jgi:hypothetical protein
LVFTVGAVQIHAESFTKLLHQVDRLTGRVDRAGRPTDTIEVGLRILEEGKKSRRECTAETNRPTGTTVGTDRVGHLGGIGGRRQRGGGRGRRPRKPWTSTRGRRLRSTEAPRRESAPVGRLQRGKVAEGAAGVDPHITVVLGTADLHTNTTTTEEGVDHHAGTVDRPEDTDTLQIGTRGGPHATKEFIPEFRIRTSKAQSSGSRIR